MEDNGWNATRNLSQTISLKQMITTLESALKLTAKKEILPLQPGDVNITFADIVKSKRILQYDPKTEFNDGIRKFVDWLLQKR